MGYSVYAIKGNPSSEAIVASLNAGEGRFGFSSVATADLRALKARIEQEGWHSLSPEEQASYYVFLLDLKVDDHVIYVDVPEWSACVTARVIGEYYWRFEDADFNHRFPVDPHSVVGFDRNGSAVHPALSSRLRVKRLWWRVNLRAEFEELLSNLRGDAQEELRPQSRLVRDIQPILLRITQTIHHTYAGRSLEELVADVFGHLPEVTEVAVKHGSSDEGADLLVRFSSGLALPGVDREDTLVVQVKANTHENWDTSAVDGMRRAFARYPEASMGLLISTANASTMALDAAMERLRDESGKQVALLIGEDTAAFLLQNGRGSLTR